MKKSFIPLMVMVAMSNAVFAEVVQVNLTKKPEFSEEGIHLDTRNGRFDMYGLHAKKSVFAAFEKAKKGQCLELDVKKGFDFGDASLINSVKECPIPQKIDLAQLDKWKPEAKDDIYEHYSFDAVVADGKSHFVVYQDGGTACAAGHHWLFNKVTKSYRKVDAGTCDDRKLKILLEGNQLTFMSGAKITAKYPIY